MARMEFKLMTFNVEEYWHDFDQRNFMRSICDLFAQKVLTDKQVKDWFTRLKAHVHSKLALVRSIIEQHMPDVVCLTEHSMGLDEDVLEKRKVMKCLTPEQLISHDDIIAALFPKKDYEHVVHETGETAKFSGLANLVAWKRSKFRGKTSSSTSGTFVTPRHKPIPGTTSCYTPRSVACVELQLLSGAKSFIVCATHLLGGRFEDSLWAEDNEAGHNERVNQVLAIQSFIESDPFTAGVPSIIAGDFNVMREGFIRGPFAQGSRKYVIGSTMLYSQEELEKDYSEKYVPYQIAVHHKLEELGYSMAYGQRDDVWEMKTSKFGGCIDWIYTKGLSSQQNEQIIETNMMERSGASDHNAVMVTLSTEPPVVPTTLPDGRRLFIFRDDAAMSKQLVSAVTAAAREAINTKGSFSLCIPAGSVVSALQGLSPGALDWSKVNVFFTGERLGMYKSYCAALEAFCDRCKIRNVFYPLLRPLFSEGVPLPEFAVTEAAAAYATLLQHHPAVDNSEPIPSFDLLLLGVGDDGHCGSLHPQSDHIKAAGDGTIVFGIPKEGKNQIAISMDVMNASKNVILAATGAKKKNAVRRALSGDFEPHDCPAALVKAKETIWYTDEASIGDYKL